MQTPRSFLKAVLLGAILLTGAHPAIAALKPFAVYDPNGNLTSRCEGTGVTRTGTACTGSTVTSLAYNALDQLTQAAKTGQDTQTYRYDDQGRRVAKLVGGTVNKQYLYNGEDIYGVYTNWTAPAALYTHGPNTDDPLIRQTASGAQYYHADGLGSIVAMTSSPAGNAIYGLARYDVWGNVTGTLVAPIPAYGYTGREPDETGLIYYRARYYDPTIGRFTQRDPIGLQGGLNQYAYTNNNPVNLTDPSGNLPQSPITLWDESNRSYVPTITYTHISSGSQSLASMSAGGASGIAKTAWDVASAFVPGSGVVDAYNAFSQGDYFLGVVALATEIPVLKGLKAETKLADVVAEDAAKLGTYQEIRAAGLTDSHHIIQNAAVRDLPGYNRNLAPAIHLPGPAFDQTTPHGIATAVQASYSGTRGTYAAERVLGYKALRKAGIGPDEARSAIESADEYFFTLGVTPSTLTRIPGR